MVGFVTVVALLGFGAHRALAQSGGGMDHSMHMMGASTAALPAGQDAYAALAAAVAALEADSTTNWSKVDIEGLRRHLIVMNDVTLGARSTQTSVPGGARMDVTGDGRVAESVRTMLRAHATMLDGMGPYRTTVDDIPGGVRFVVTAANPQDQATVARIRGLGFAGLLTLGAHHAQHHMALARGEAMMHQ
jgi:hypothetical protein